MLPKILNPDKKLQAYVIGLAIGDGNLSNPNGRAVRLRITCDKKYPTLLKRTRSSLKKLLPQNKVSVVNRKGCLDVYCYSNHWEKLLGWEAKKGSKINQKIKVPYWIKENSEFSKRCLRGLFETDGSVYYDRKYLMTNFVTYIPSLANDVMEMINKMGFNPHLYKIKENTGIKYTVRISKNTAKFIKMIELSKK